MADTPGAAWTPTKAGMPGRNLPRLETHPEGEQKYPEEGDPNPQPEGVKQRTAAQNARRRRKRQRYRAKKRAKAQAEQEAILGSLQDDQKENDDGTYSVPPAALPAPINVDFANLNLQTSENEVKDALQALAAGERVIGSPTKLRRISQAIWGLAHPTGVTDEVRLTQLSEQINRMGPDTPEVVAQEFKQLMIKLHPNEIPDLQLEIRMKYLTDRLEALSGGVGPKGVKAEDMEEYSCVCEEFRQIFRHTNPEAAAEIDNHVEIKVRYHPLRRSPHKPPLSPLDPSAPVRQCMICVENFEDNNGPRGNFYRIHGRLCSCSSDYDICNLCFIRNFRTNAAPCSDPFCFNRHMKCSTCRADLVLGDTIQRWCRSNYECSDMIEMAMQNGGNVINRED